MAMQQPEVRIDPEDGQPRTFEELRVLCRDRYTEQEIQEYWDMSMIVHEGQAIHSVADDPFLTHAPASATRAPGPAGTMSQQSGGLPTPTMPPGSPALSAGSVGGPRTLAREAQTSARMAEGPAPGDVKADPFLTSDRNRDVADVRQDPFLTQGDSRTPPEVRAAYDPAGAQGRRQQVLQAAAAAKKHWTESLYRLLGPGDPNRIPSTRNVLVFGPWLLFLWVMMLWLVLQHYSKVAATALTALTMLASLAATFLWYVGRRGGPVSLLTMGLLCFVAALAGAFAGEYGWERFYRQYWWTQTGFQDGASSATTPALARADYAVVDFWDAKAEMTINGSRVEPTMAAGYKDTDYYCVAPVLTPGSAGAGLRRVNYWVVGINCCQKYGSFTCDDSREWDAGRGLVMLEGGYPCPTCNNDNFRKAVIKAEAVHDLVSAPGALFVRWVKEPSSTILDMLLQALSYIVVCAFLAGAASALLGSLAWYYGVGLQRTAGQSDLDLGSRGNIVLDATSLNAGKPGRQMFMPPSPASAAKLY